MRITPFFIWLFTITISTLAAVVSPAYRAAFSCIAAAHLPVFAMGIRISRLQFFGKVYCCDSTKSNTIALTFDDGPDPDLTPDILSILQKHSIQATFFVIGVKVEKNPAVVKQCFDTGHTIACHDLSHSLLSNFRTTGPLMRDITGAQAIIHTAIGKKPLLYRPPVGLVNPHTYTVLNRLCMHCIGWSRKAGDAGNRRLYRIKKIHTLCKPGAVVLLHDTRPKEEYKEEILKQIDMLCVAIKQQGLTAVTVGEMFGIKAYE